MKFKIGDFIECIDPIVNLTTGGIYKVINVHNRYISIDCEDIRDGQKIIGVYARRFKLSKEYKIKYILKHYEDVDKHIRTFC